MALFRLQALTESYGGSYESFDPLLEYMNVQEAVEATFEPVYEGVVETIKTIIRKIIEALKKFKDWFLGLFKKKKKDDEEKAEQEEEKTTAVILNNTAKQGPSLPAPEKKASLSAPEERKALPAPAKQLPTPAKSVPSPKAAKNFSGNVAYTKAEIELLDGLVKIIPTRGDYISPAPITDHTGALARLLAENNSEIVNRIDEFKKDNENIKNRMEEQTGKFREYYNKVKSYDTSKKGGSTDTVEIAWKSFQSKYFEFARTGIQTQFTKNIQEFSSAITKEIDKLQSAYKKVEGRVAHNGQDALNSATIQKHWAVTSEILNAGMKSVKEIETMGSNLYGLYHAKVRAIVG